MTNSIELKEIFNNFINQHIPKMEQYLKDCKKYESAWMLWEECQIGSNSWNNLNAHPTWDLNYKYRRKNSEKIKQEIFDPIRHALKINQ